MKSKRWTELANEIDSVVIDRTMKQKEDSECTICESRLHRVMVPFLSEVERLEE